MNTDVSVRSVANVQAVLGEGPVWIGSAQALVWVDIEGLKIFRLGQDGAVDTWDTPFRIGSLAPRQQGGFIGGTERGLAVIDLEAGRFEPVADPEPDRPTNRFNDGKVDRNGFFWAGTMDDQERLDSGALYRIDKDLEWSRADDGYRVTNGPAFSVRGDRMYHNDSARQLTYVFDLDPDGVVSDRRIFAAYHADDGYPDGMTVDSQDCVWIAFWDGWCVRRFSPEGDPIGEVKLPVQRPTSCAFGGPRLDKLYVTSASIGLSAAQRAEQPCAGNLFMLDTGVTGVADLPFAG